MDIDMTKVSAALKAKGISLECSECGGKCDLDRDLGVVQQWNGKGMGPLVGKNLAPCAQVVCMGCGHIRSFNIGVLIA